jgi:hypothetical protein
MPLMENAEVREIVAQSGWCVIKVPADEDNPGFAYTVGLGTSFAHPEVIVLGLDPSVMHEMLNAIGELVSQGSAFHTGESSPDVLAGYEVQFVEVSPAAFDSYLGRAVEYYDGGQFSSLQCIWPDKEGRYPWTAGVSDWVRWSQPALTDGPRVTFEKPDA